MEPGCLCFNEMKNFENTHSAISLLQKRVNFTNSNYSGYLDFDFETIPQNLEGFLNLLK